MGKFIAVIVFALLAGCSQTKPPASVVTDQPAVLVVAGPTSPLMQEFTTHEACGEAAAHIEIRSGGRYFAHCVAR